MKIVFVLDCYGILKNGTSATAIRFAQELRKRGHQVKILGVDSLDPKTKVEDKDFYPIKKYHFPVFQSLIEKEGFCFAGTDYKTMTEVIKDADLVHVFLPFPFEKRGRLIAESLNIPVTSAFHLQPDAITYVLHMEKWKFLSWCFYRAFYHKLYRYTKQVHCPSEMIADVLKKMKYKNCTTHVISNGVTDYFHPLEAKKPETLKDKFIVLMIGRYAREKRQDIIIKAIGRSKHNKDIQLILSGQGPNENELKKLSENKLANPVIMGFNDHPHLRELINYSDLYVHASDSEIEGIACIEAFACGLVPVISDSSLSATNRFALDPKCLFHKNDVQDLADKIDYFYEHPEFRKELSAKYAEYAKSFALNLQVDKFEDFLKQGIEDKKNKTDIPSVHPYKSNIRKVKKVKKIIAPYLSSPSVWDK
jgi:glycosyltransferase involved in cell wall biosynthesis